MKYAVVILVAVVMSACAECDPGAFRCQGQDLEVCDGDGRWELTMDCEGIDSFDDSTGWECCDVDAGPGCYPDEECGE